LTGDELFKPIKQVHARSFQKEEEGGGEEEEAEEHKKERKIELKTQFKTKHIHS
jgi:hypothetical protein